MQPASALSPPHRASLRRDVLCGLTVTMVGLPQCIAYAMMSGAPPAYGLATAAVPGFVAAVVGRSAQVVTGPTNTTGLLILAALGPYLATNGLATSDGLTVLATLTLLAGVLRLATAYLGAAIITDFLPESVLVGFTAGAGVLIGVMQLDEAIGLDAVRGGGLAGELRGLSARLEAHELPRLGAVGVAGFTIVAVALGRRFRPRWPVALVAVLVAAVAAELLDMDAAGGVPIVADRATISLGWPPGALPSRDPAVWRDMLVPALAIALLGTLELAVTARAGGARVDMKREIVGQGWANVAGAFTSSIPASASLTRSALLRLGGAETRRAAALAALFVVPVLLFAAPLAGKIPQASLAGVLLVTATAMIDVTRIKRMWVAAHATRFLLVVTFVATLVLPLEWAILAGAGLGLAIHLLETTRPRLQLLEPTPDGLHPPAGTARADTLVLSVSGNLHYAAVRGFFDGARVASERAGRLLVIDLSFAHGLRYAALLALERLAADRAAHGRELILAGVDEEFLGLLARTRSALRALPYDPRPGMSVRKALDDHRAATPLAR